MRFWGGRRPVETAPPQSISALERMFGVVERRALEEQEVGEVKRGALLAEEVWSEDRSKFEARVAVAKKHGWVPLT